MAASPWARPTCLGEVATAPPCTPGGGGTGTAGGLPWDEGCLHSAKKKQWQSGTGAFLLRTAIFPYSTDELRHQAISRASAQLCVSIQTEVWTRCSTNRISVRHSKAFNAPKSPHCPISPPVNSTTPQENTFIRGFLPLGTLAIFLFPSVVLQQPGSVLWGRYMSK